MESRFGNSFGAVHIHRDRQSSDLARSIHAKAFTVGADVFFSDGQYEPRTSTGQRLIAHELTHVVQQGASPSSVTALSGSQSRPAVTPLGNAGAIPVQRFAVEDCSADEAKQIQAAYAAVRPAVARTVNRIDDKDAHTALVRYFGATGPSKTSAIALRLLQISKGLDTATVECEAPDSFAYGPFCSGALAYVRPVPAFFGFGHIHLCQPQFAALSLSRQMSTLVHEGAHRYVGASDNAYYDASCGETSETQALSDSDRFDNADSYGCLVETLG
jgi:hypothetical protein